MIRVLIYLVIVALLAFGAVWLAERPGDVVITWQGERVETSVMVLMAAAAAVAVAAVVLWSIVRAIVRSPDAVSRFLRNRRGVRGYQAVSHGPDRGRLRRCARRQEVHRRGQAHRAERAAHAAAERAGGAARRRPRRGRRHLPADGGPRRHQAARPARPVRRGAAAQRPRRRAALCRGGRQAGARSPAWAGQAVLEFRCVAGDWSGALARLERNMKSGLIDKTAYRRQRAVLLTAQALAAEDGVAPPTPGQPDAGRERAQALALEAVKLAPDLVPAAALAGRLLGAAGEKRKATRIIEAAWRANPHPDLADAFAHLRPGNSARERLARVESLAGKAPGDAEAAIAVARAALDAKEFAVARAALAPLLEAPTRRVAALMAALETAGRATRAAAANGWRARSTRAAIRPGPPTATCPITGCRSRR